MIHATFHLLAPLSHGSFGDASEGNAVLLRREPIVSLSGFPRVPCLSGNAIRGRLRRVTMRALIDAGGLSRAAFVADGMGRRWDRMYAALANGGHLDGSEARVDPERIRELRASLPPLSVYGSALYSWMMPGRARVGIGWLVCAETQEAGLVTGTGAAPAEEQVTEIGHVRHIDRTEADPEQSGVTPMPVTIEAIATGARLQTTIRLERGCTSMEASCVAWGLDQIQDIGAKAGAGLGAVRVDHDGDGSEYAAWLTSSRPAIREALLRLAAEVG